MLGLLAVAVMLPSIATQRVAASSSISLDEPFTGATLNNPTKWISMRGGTANEWPCLTAASTPLTVTPGTVEACVNQGGSTAVSGEGAMRLTRRRPAGVGEPKGSAGSLLYTDALSATEGLDISFSIRMESNEAADGISFFLKDGANAANTVGQAGGSLGYSLLGPDPLNPNNLVPLVGVPGALFGVGFDGFGSFSADAIASADPVCPNTGATRGAIRSFPSLAQAKSSLVVRGPDLSGSKDGSVGYCYLAGMDVTFSSSTFQRVRVKVDPQSGASTTLSVYLAPHTSPTVLPAAPTLTTTVALTSTFRFGFSASTGYWSNNHDLRGLTIRPAGPTLTSVATSAATGSGTGPTSGGTTLTITGSGIDPAATVTVDGTPCTSVSVTGGGTELTCVTPAGTPGAKQVTITNPNGGPTYGAFTYLNPTPTVTGVSPRTGAPSGGNTVTINGTGFVDGASVTMGGQACTSVVVLSSTSLTCTAPASTEGTVVDMEVTNVGPVSGTGVGVYTYVTALSSPAATVSTTTTTVVAPAPESPPIEQGFSETLPNTGSDAIENLAFALVLFVLSSIVLVGRRRLIERNI
jgi:hypothetical protein